MPQDASIERRSASNALSSSPHSITHGASMNRDQFKSSVLEAAGRVQERAGKFVGSPSQQVKGQNKQAAGQTHQVLGDVPQVLRHAAPK
jgi:uncharacterized protein YjbJ (UPF0337 family)